MSYTQLKLIMILQNLTKLCPSAAIAKALFLVPHTQLRLSTQCPPDDNVDAAEAKPQHFMTAQCEAQMNVQIGAELTASHTYLAMAAYCAQSNVALLGAAGG